MSWKEIITFLVKQTGCNAKRVKDVFMEGPGILYKVEEKIMMVLEQVSGIRYPWA